MTDLMLLETLNGGDLVQRGNDLATVSGVENTPYLAMFGGKRWWGNYLISDRPFASKTEEALNTQPLTSAGRKRIQEAVDADLDYLRGIEGTTYSAEVVIVGQNRVQIDGEINGEEFSYLWNPGTPDPLLVQAERLLPLWRSPWLTPGVDNPDPGSFMSYAVTPFTMVDGLSTVSILAGTIGDEDGETDRLTYLNTVVKPANSMRGLFVIDSDGWVSYRQGLGENYTLSVAPEVLYRILMAQYNVMSAGVAPSYGYRGAGSKQIVDWTDGTVTYIPDGGGAPGTASHVYSSAGNVRVLIYHNDVMESLTFGGATNFRHRALSGIIQSTLENFTLQDGAFFNTPAYLPLEACAHNLKFLKVELTQINGFLGLWDNNFATIQNIQLRYNTLPSAEVDAAFNGLVANSPSCVGGMVTFDTSLQGPHAPPTGASDPARAALASAGCTVTTD